MGKQDASELRKNQIVSFLRGTVASANEIAAKTEIPYVTVTRLIKQLQAEHQVTMVNYRHGDGGYKYTAQEVDSMLFLESFGNTIPTIEMLIEFATRAKLNEGQFTSDAVNKSVHLMAQSLATIFHAAYQINVDGRTDAEALVAAKETLIKCEKTFGEMAHLCRQIVDERRYFDNRELLELTKSKLWNSRLVEEAYDLLTPHVPIGESVPTGNPEAVGY
jgi:hypothetical protein